MSRKAVSVCALLSVALLASPVRPQEATPAPAEAAIRSLLQDDLWREALQEAQAAHRRLPQDRDLTAVLGEALFRAGRFEEVDRLLGPLAAEPTAPARALAVLGRLRAAEGRRLQAAELLDRARRAAPEDRDILYWSADLAASRDDALELMQRYLELSEGDDPDRIEAAQGLVRFFNELGERPIWVAEQRPERLELPLIELWDQQGRPQGFVVEARVGPKNKKVNLLLDTGAHGLFIVERKTRKSGFTELSEGTLFGGGGEKRHRTVRGLFSSFAIGDLRFSNALAKVTGEFDATGRYHGLLGISVFDGYRVTLDLKRRRLILEPAATERTGERFWWVSGQMLVRAATTSEDSGLFIFDSGASGSVLSRGYLAEVEEAVVGGPTAVQSFGGIVEEARLVDGVELSFGGASSAGSLRTYDFSLRSKVGGVEISGLVGLDLLARRRVVIDTERQRVALD